MVNGKRGDHPYTDIVVYGNDLGRPEIAAKVRELDAVGDAGLRDLVSDLLMFMDQLLDQEYWRERLVHHLDSIRRLADGGATKTRE